MSRPVVLGKRRRISSSSEPDSDEDERKPPPEKSLRGGKDQINSVIDVEESETSHSATSNPETSDSESEVAAGCRWPRVDEAARQIDVTVAPVGHQGQYSCSECQQSFSRRFCLARHKKQQHQISLRACDVCEWSQHCTNAKYYSHLRSRHPTLKIKGRRPMVRNFNEVDFVCIYCEPRRVFASFEELKQHLEGTHDRNFACTRCPKAFGQAIGLTRHIDSIHEAQSSAS